MLKGRVLSEASIAPLTTTSWMCSGVAEGTKSSMLTRGTLLPTCGKASLCEGRQIKIINSNPVQGGVYSYGKVAGIITSIMIAILLLLQLIPPLGKRVLRAVDCIRTHRTELKEARGKLTNNRLEALKKALPGDVSSDLKKYLEGIDGQEDYGLLKSAGYTPDRIENIVKCLVPLFIKDVWKERLYSTNPEVNEQISQIKAETPHSFLKKARQIPQLQSTVALLSLALKAYEEKQQTHRLKEAQKALPLSKQERLLQLVPFVLEVREMESFLCSKGILGKDTQTPQFQAGVVFLQIHVEHLRDENFPSNLQDVIKGIRSPCDEGREKGVQKEVREKLDQMIRSGIYRKLLNRHGRENPLVSLIQNLSGAFRLESKGMLELENLGELYLSKVKKDRGQLAEKGQLTYLSDAMDDSIGKHHWSYKIESFFDKLLVLVRYPEKTMMSYIGHQPDTALEYNSYKVGNCDMAYGDYSLGERSMRALLGPTPTGDDLFVAQLDAMKETGGLHLQHNLEHPGFSKGDLKRVQYLMDLEQKYPHTFRLFSTPLDGEVWSLKGEAGEYFKDYKSAEEFFLKFGTFAFTNRLEKPVSSFHELQGEAHRKMEGKGDNGFYIGKEVMTDQQVRLAFKYASEAFAHAEPSSGDCRRLTRALQVGVEGMLAVGAVVKTLKDSEPDKVEEAVWQATFGQACKLDIDRGIVMNVMTRVYFDLIGGKEMSEKSINETIGIVIGRAEMAAGRTIIADRYQPLSDSIRLIGKDELRVKNALRSYMHQAFGVDTPSQLSFQT